MSDNNQPAPKLPKTGLTTKHVVLILGSVAIIGVTIVAALYFLRPEPEVALPLNTGAKVVNMENVMEIDSEIKDKVAKGMFETHMNAIWSFPDGKSASSDAVMGNAASNNYSFYFTVTLSDTGETVFTSGLMPVGTQIAEIKLETELAAGTYPAYVTINMVEDDGEPVENNMGINVTLVIKA